MLFVSKYKEISFLNFNCFEFLNRKRFISTDSSESSKNTYFHFFSSQTFKFIEWLNDEIKISLHINTDETLLICSYFAWTVILLWHSVDVIFFHILHFSVVVYLEFPFSFCSCLIKNMLYEKWESYNNVWPKRCLTTKTSTVNAKARKKVRSFKNVKICKWE